ncbi:hypothetical protein BJF79_32420 [Actinomadura sp. CNU-125]|uniref:hypothetical protein n=1 Tax=Actinomadura sp. CNU-125 TaxID=1904961 RepID=UPI00095A045A|nr:hypothetical protein [Actinomadura sp. CNU-125]OLT35465.1 hypothetical protein BJF79_32420 [Actinomadura sp. CNU-125]
MPKMTDYVRAGFDRRRRPWDRAELPEWWDLVVWAGLAALIAMLLLGAVFGRDDASGAATGDDAGFAVRTLNPHTFTPAPTPSGDGPASSGEPPGGDDFTATAPCGTPMTGGGTAVVPAGARNAALAAAEAAGHRRLDGRPVRRDRAAVPGARDPGGFRGRGADRPGPRRDGDGPVPVQRDDPAGRRGADRPVRITVERGPEGYAVRAP